jgi:hypothetical protein
VHEDKAAAGADPSVHTLDAQFSKATWQIQMRMDADGKIAAFRIHPPPDPQQ